MKTYFYNQSIKNISIALADMFDDIYIGVYTSAGTLDRTVKVPFTLGPVDKNYQIRMEGYSQEGGTKYYPKYPRIALSFDGMKRAEDRSSGVNEVREFNLPNTLLHDATGFITDPQPTPFDFQFSLEYLATTRDDFCQITEQILVYYNPDLILRVKEFSGVNIERDLPVILQDFSISYDNEPLDETKRRLITGKISFNVEGFLYFPRVTNTAIIKTIESKYWLSDYSIDTSVNIDTYLTSGVEGTSAGTIETSAIPATSAYNFSGYDSDNNVYWFTSANT